MTIDKDGAIVPGQAWWYENGPLIRDTENPYNIEFFIGVPYNEEQKAQYKQIAELKRKLRDSDYRACKFADGAYTEEEYAPIRAERAAWRAEINRIEETFAPPTLTREEMDRAEKIAMETLKEQFEAETGEQVEEIKEVKGGLNG